VRCIAKCINKHPQQLETKKGRHDVDTYPPHLANVIQLLVYLLGRTKCEVILVAPYHGRLLGSLSRKARIDIVHCTSVPVTVDDLDLGGTHELSVDRLDVLGCQLLDAIGKLQDRCICLVLRPISILQHLVSRQCQIWVGANQSAVIERGEWQGTCLVYVEQSVHECFRILHFARVCELDKRRDESISRQCPDRLRARSLMFPEKRRTLAPTYLGHEFTVLIEMHGL
jgi:hypothetical protein